MTKIEIEQAVIASYKQVITNSDKSYDATVDTNTPIMGSESPFDSIDLVTFIVALEQMIEDDWSFSVTLADDRAMSQTISPFKTIGTISDYIELLIKEQQ
jgi:acyl carrier protein